MSLTISLAIFNNCAFRISKNQSVLLLGFVVVTLTGDF